MLLLGMELAQKNTDGGCGFSRSPAEHVKILLPKFLNLLIASKEGSGMKTDCSMKPNELRGQRGSTDAKVVRLRWNERDKQPWCLRCLWNTCQLL